MKSDKEKKQKENLIFLKHEMKKNKLCKYTIHLNLHGFVHVLDDLSSVDEAKGEDVRIIWITQSVSVPARLVKPFLIVIKLPLKL